MYWFGLKRRSIHKKKVLTGDTNNEVSRDNNEEDEEKDDDIEKDEEQVDKNHCSSPQPVSSSSDCLQNGEIDESSNSSKDKQDLSKSSAEDQLKEISEPSYESNDQISTLHDEDDFDDKKVEDQEKHDIERQSRVNHLTATVTLTSLPADSILSGTNISQDNYYNAIR